ncbi:E3 ubiquitin-protein ligase TRIM21-like isoform X2 [Macrosteles quadrilineatus]|uniref:E3 ubiquitin-protein ligase TRIM21-like isoform X2 n=1 Tax=Macrosteles quadrilineatus TaxID=74068 RepID=UPI0023E17EBC|nr:E3 ubiquitin-protein ligase TRIM21-like isoform X2 [Macrosteles quadrilineatus]
MSKLKKGPEVISVVSVFPIGQPCCFSLIGGVVANGAISVPLYIDGLQDELMCSICVEPYVEPTALNCGHMFCSKCISEWMNKKRFCPLCHRSVSTTVRIHMDALIQRTKLMSKKAETRREAHLSQQKKRKSLETEYSPKKLCSETETNSDAPVETTTIPVETVTYYLPSMGPSTTNHTEGNDCNQPGTSRQPPPIAVVNPSNVPVAQIPMPAAPRVQTNTSGEADTVIDLTDL